MDQKGKSSDIQSVLFDKKLWTTRKARSWLSKKKLKRIKRVDVTENNYRYRIRPPENFKRMITKKSKSGISLIIGFY